ncbi:hypothetical protein [Synechocystis sp. PCC 7509]|uniref:hypothetical protein n=1 Tax=Synechocystis sp. PCC 7509 TaxID=927677 RepID=UPI0002ACAEE4|nr:hypothetical protein [Synechocystis sp. PCC 7509]
MTNDSLGFKRFATTQLLYKVCLIALTVPFLASPGIAKENEYGNENATYAIGLWGDLPYSDLQATIGVPNLIADMNSQNLTFTAHNGDLKAGNSTLNSVTPTTCSNDLYAQAVGYFNALKAPAVFTPGDNDWTDCDRPSNGGFNSRERLDYERQIFFSTKFSLGQRPLAQVVQKEPLCLGANASVPCSENRRWAVRGVTYATMNIQGSCNNLCDTAPDQQEYAARNTANIAWMKQTFAEAKARNSVAVMFISQGNPGWDLSDGTRAPLRDPKTLAQTDGQPDGYQDFLLALRDETIAFCKPVSYVHGDSHYHRIDKPFQDAQGNRIENFTRVETFGNSAANGNNEVQWVKVIVNPRSREVFSYQGQIVPGNRVAVPVP